MLYLYNTLGEAPVAKAWRDGAGRAGETVADSVQEPATTRGEGVLRWGGGYVGKQLVLPAIHEGPVAGDAEGYAVNNVVPR